MRKILLAVKQIYKTNSKIWQQLYLLLILLFIINPSYATSKNNDFIVHEHTLENGLKILIKEDHRAPVVVQQLWYKIGTSYEHSGITGLSHALEHMMFKGTEKYPTGVFNRMVTENGAEDNAFTSQDYTAYYQVIAKDRLETMMELESDRMRGLTLPPAEFKKEIEVVKEERRWRTDDKPISLTREQFNATAFLTSPYHNPVIGWMNDLDNMKIEDLRAWYKKWYTPNNAVLVIVGDVEPKKVFALAKKYYGAIPAGKLPTVKPRLEIPQKGKREIIVKAPAKVPYLRMGYKVPGFINIKNKSEAYALEVLSAILDGGSSARLAKNLVRGKEIATTVSAGYYGYGRLSDLFVLSGIPAKDSDVKTLEKALLAEVKKLQTELVDPKELQRVKAQTISSEIFERDSIQHIAYLLGSLEMTGIGYQLINDYVDNISAVTAQQVQDVAKKYLIEDTLTIAKLAPQPIKQKK